MQIERTWLHFEENGEQISGRKGEIKQDKNGSLYFEVHDVMVDGDTVRVHINDFIEDIIDDIETEYVTISCKDAEKKYVKVYPCHDEVKSNLVLQECVDEESFLSRKEQLLKAVADLIRFRDSLSYRDEIVDDLIYKLQDYLQNQLGEVLLDVD